MPKKRKSKAAREAQAASIAGYSLLIFLALLVFLSLVSGWMGVAGGWISAFSRGLFGAMAYVWPFYLIVLAVLGLCREKIRDAHLGVRLWLGAVALLLLGAMIHICSSECEAFLREGNLLSNLYLGALEGASGGVVGGLIAYPFYRLLSFVGSLIVLGFLFAFSTIISAGPALLRLKQILFPYTAREITETVQETLPPKKDKPQKRAADAFGDVQEVSTRKKKSALDVPLTTRTEDQSAPEEPPAAEAPEKPDEPAIDPIPIMKAIGAQIPEEEKPEPPEPAPQPLAAAPEKGEEDEFSHYRLPDISLLKPATGPAVKADESEMRATAKKITETLANFRLETKVVNITRGPSVTRYELVPGAGVRINRVASLSDDLALALKAAAVRIEAPIPGKGTIGIEVANREVSPIRMRRLVGSASFRNAKSKLTAALGQDINGETILCDIAAMPHLLIAGATGSGKSVCINTMIMSILFRARPDEVKMILVDPKKIELEPYNGLPHLITPVVTDLRKASGALQWAVTEMQNRYKLFSETGARNIQSYNEQRLKNGEKPLHSILIVIDELADIMMSAPREVEESICRLAALARAAGMHLIVATQRPSVDVITGVIKANIPSRIAFAVASAVDSRTILDASGAEKLLGKGDMLYMPIGRNKPLRLQGCFVSDEEIKLVTDSIKAQCQAADYDEEVIRQIDQNAASAAPASGGDSAEPGDEHDPLLADAVEAVVEAGQCSVSLLQRKVKLGFSRAGRIVDEMEALGIVGPYQGSKPREVLITRDQWLEMRMRMESQE